MQPIDWVTPTSAIVYYPGCFFVLFCFLLNALSHEKLDSRRFALGHG
jgi:hypothetical protein